MPPKVAKNIESAAPKTKPTAPKARWSNFLITVNTNKRHQNKDPEFRAQEKKLRETMDTLLEDANLRRLIVIDGPGDSYDKSIATINIDGMTEIAPTTSTLHIHVLVSIHHRTKLKLDYEALKRDICAALGPCYVYNRVYSSAETNVRDYVYKSRGGVVGK